jgi:hypothetical protein
MPVSDELGKLAARAKEAEDRVDAAREKAKADLEEDVELTRTAVEKQNKVLRELASEEKGRISDYWNELQAAWNEIVAKVREDIEARKGEHDLHKAQRRATGQRTTPGSRSTSRTPRSSRPSTPRSTQPSQGWRQTSYRSKRAQPPETASRSPA